MRQSRQRTFPATAKFIGATPPKVAVSATLTENITRHLQVVPSRDASAVPLWHEKYTYIHRLYKPEPRQQSALQVQPTSTPWQFRDSKDSYVALSTEQRTDVLIQSIRQHY